MAASGRKQPVGKDTIVRHKLFRTLAALLGLAFVVLAIPIGNLDRGFWPPWVIIISFIGTGAVFIYYAATGRFPIFSKK